MKFEDLYQLSSKIKNLPLPGEEAHFLMEPAMRREWRNLEKIEKRNPKHSAVMALFYPKNEIAHILLILRKSYKGVHSNQIGFPGGKVEAADKNLLDTALRETSEEVGVKGSDIEVLKELTRLYIPPSNFWVQPFLGMFPNPYPFEVQVSEVENLVEVSVQDFLDDSKLIKQNLNTSYAQNIEVPAFMLNGHTVWGATGMMLNEIKSLLRQLL
ncbi:NUDIX hydrolase [Croceivirga thetidis]|uniref:CoA pyrophosphatase n=1 Tax=Croceivirga thetidis TaxID=2721623 RepID=A0ABX1GS44_9FLAO|nr:CoA pyrophosphatase [Croceivirga thetidis]NKI31886.1 CoA pyrophosphatase [Croceivirga thetidis]